jgi:hypothetical protein
MRGCGHKRGLCSGRAPSLAKDRQGPEYRSLAVLKALSLPAVCNPETPLNRPASRPIGTPGSKLTRFKRDR